MCLIALVGLIAPRLLLFFIWLLTDWCSRAFEGWFWPLLGFALMPYTTLVYMWAMIANDNHFSFGYGVLMVIAIIFDLASDTFASTDNRS